MEWSDDAIIAKDRNGKITIWNRGAERLFGYTASEAVGRPISILIPQDRRDEETLILDRIFRGEQIEHFETFRRRKDGSLVEVSLTISPIRNRAGEIIGASKVARNFAKSRRTIEKQNLLLAEMKHRTKNLAAVIEALARQSRPRNEPAVDVFVGAFVGRLHALLSTGELILGSATRTADFRDILEKVLQPFVDPNQTTPIAIDGPSLVLAEATAANLGLAMHELATNSLKYGALQAERGRVSVTWSIQPTKNANRVQIEWKESGAVVTGEPKTTGFGSRIIRSAVASEKFGKTDLSFESDGLRCRFDFLTNVRS